MIATHPEPDRPRPPRRHPVAWGLGVFIVACGVFGHGLRDEKDFVDEWAYVAQSFFADLFFEGRRDDPAWLTYPAIDLPPGAKYLVGLALGAAGYPRPGPAASVAWYGNTKWRRDIPGMLLVARAPMVPLGALGCVAIFAIGRRTFGFPAGLVAAALLMASPTYWLHARRAMSDIPAESLGLVALAFGLAAWSRWVGDGGGSAHGAGRLLPSDGSSSSILSPFKGGGSEREQGRRAKAFLLAFALSLLAGAFVGLAVLSKLSGSLAGMVLAAWAGLGLGLRGVSWSSKLGLLAATIASGVFALAIFTALNPTLTAHPGGPLPPGTERVAALPFWGRVRLVEDHRVTVSAVGQRDFPHNALTTLPAKAAAVAVQGFGRFSPLGPRHSDSTRRFDRDQDGPVLVWLPLVLAGAVVSFRRGLDQRARGEPPTAWAVLLGAVVALVVVTSFIPLAWDRYFLPIQPGAVLLASAALTAPLAWSRRREGA